MVESAGTWTQPNQTLSQTTIQIADNLGIDIRGHLTRIITSEDIPRYDLLLVMEDGHMEALLNEFPSVKGKIYLLSEAAGRAAYNIPDPAKTGNPEPIFREIFDVVTGGFPLICDLANTLHRLNSANREV